jgi:EmrB/QacA subfamily drug resistance transporter
MERGGFSTRLYVGLITGVFMGALDLTIVAPAIPHIGTSLQVSPPAVVLAFSVYAAFYAVSVPVMSKLADVRGYGQIYRGSLLLFAGGSALAALSPTIAVLIIARVVQGIGGGGLFPVAQAIVGTTLEDRHQGRVLGILVGVFALGGILGPNLGGFLAQTLSWRWIFWINVPLGALGLLFVRGIDVPSMARRAKVDWLGAALIALGLGSFVLFLESLRHVERSVLNVHTGGLFLSMVLGLGLFTFVEGRRRDPVVDLAFVRSPAVTPLLLISLFVGYALLAGVVFTPLYAQMAYGASTLASGAVLNAAAVGLGASSYVAGRLSKKHTSNRLILLGMILTAAGLAGMILLRDTVQGLLFGLVLLGMGLGFTQGPLSHAGLRLAPSDKQGQISGLIAITRSMGGAAGMTLAGVLLSRSIERRRSASFAIDPSELWGQPGGLQALSPETAESVRAAMLAGLVSGWYWALGAALLGLLACAFLRSEGSSERG